MASLTPAELGGVEFIGPSRTYVEPDDVCSSRALTRVTMAVECHGLLADEPACSSQRSPSTATSSSPVEGDLPRRRRYHLARCIGGFAFDFGRDDGCAEEVEDEPLLPFAAVEAAEAAEVADVPAVATAAAAGAAASGAAGGTAAAGGAAAADEAFAFLFAEPAGDTFGSGGGGGGRRGGGGGGDGSAPAAADGKAPPLPSMAAGGVPAGRNLSINIFGIGEDLTSR